MTTTATLAVLVSVAAALALVTAASSIVTPAFSITTPPPPHRCKKHHGCLVHEE